ncbi:hypothetical protein [Streptomyces sp. NPDC017260]|uniref:hypothetical protein n=1 Tax=unclassified Streptomyces TaxID=2593676 RepID=UPI00379D5A05
MHRRKPRERPEIPQAPHGGVVARRESSRAVAAAPPLHTADAFREVQRSAGNAAVTRVIARSARPTAASERQDEAASPVSAGQASAPSVDVAHGPDWAVAVQRVTDQAKHLEEVLPREEWYRLQLDPRHHDEARRTHPNNPGELYDHQQSPGFQGSMNAAYEQYLNDPATIDHRVNFRMYEAMHNTVGSQLGNQVEKSGEVGLHTMYPLRADSPTPSVLDEEIGGRPLTVKADPLMRFGIVPRDPLTWSGHFQPHGADGMYTETLYRDTEVEGILDDVFNRFYEKVGAARAPREKLKAIAWAVRTIHIIHPYEDTNRRLNVHVLLPRLLMAAGFKPVIFKDMDELFQGGRSLEKVADALESGQAMDLLSDSIEATAPQYEPEWHQRGQFARREEPMPAPQGTSTELIEIPDF